MVLWVSIPSSKKILWPLQLYPTELITLKYYTAWIATILALVSCADIPLT